MDMLENNDTRKRRTPPVKALVLAAALAVGCVLSIAAGLPARMYNFMSGGTLTALPGTDQISMTLDGEETAPVRVEDGRLWFEADGQKVDITDKVDENTPYIYEHTDAATGEKGYVIVGGTVDDFGWVELVQMGKATAMSGSNFADAGKIELSELAEAPDGVYVAEDSAYGADCQVIDSGASRPWLDAALARLGLDADIVG